MSTTTLSSASSSPGRRLVGALGFESSKLAGVRSTWWILALAMVVGAGTSWLLGSSVLASGLNGYDTTTPAPMIAGQSLLLSRVGIVIVAALAIGREYSTRSIVTSLQSVSVRGRLLGAKAFVVALAGGVTGAATVALGTPIAAACAGDFGRFTGADLLRATTGAGLGMALLSLLVVGLGAALRNVAATVLAVLALLHVVPLGLRLLHQSALDEFTRSLPGEALSALVSPAGDGLAWSVALLSLAGWAVVGLAAGYVVLRVRDA